MYVFMYVPLCATNDVYFRVSIENHALQMNKGQLSSPYLPLFFVSFNLFALFLLFFFYFLLGKSLFSFVQRLLTVHGRSAVPPNARNQILVAWCVCLPHLREAQSCIMIDSIFSSTKPTASSQPLIHIVYLNMPQTASALSHLSKTPPTDE